MTSAGHSSSRRVKVSVIGAVAQVPSSSMVTCATITMSSPGHFARRKDRFAHFVEIVEGFEDQQIDAGFDQRLGLFAENRRALRRNEVGPSGSMRTPSGPMAPATKA